METIKKALLAEHYLFLAKSMAEKLEEDNSTLSLKIQDAESECRDLIQRLVGKGHKYPKTFSIKRFEPEIIIEE